MSRHRTCQPCCKCEKVALTRLHATLLRSLAPVDGGYGHLASSSDGKPPSFVGTASPLQVLDQFSKSSALTLAAHWPFNESYVYSSSPIQFPLGKHLSAAFNVAALPNGKTPWSFTLRQPRHVPVGWQLENPSLPPQVPMPTEPPAGPYPCGAIASGGAPGSPGQTSGSGGTGGSGPIYSAWIYKCDIVVDEVPYFGVGGIYYPTGGEPTHMTGSVVVKYHSGEEFVVGYRLVPADDGIIGPAGYEYLGLGPPPTLTDLREVYETENAGLAGQRYAIVWDRFYGETAISIGSWPPPTAPMNNGAPVYYVPPSTQSFSVGAGSFALLPASEDSGTLVVGASIACGPVAANAEVSSPFEHETTRSAHAQPGFTNTTIKGISGRRMWLYRNGELVLTNAENPVPFTEWQCRAATLEDGSYLLVDSYDQASDPPEYERTAPKWLKTYASFVRDSTPPVVWWLPVDDSYADGAYGTPLRLFATEPVFVNGSLLTPFDFRPFAGAPFNVLQPVGTHILTAYQPSQLADRGGNRPLSSGTQPWTVHAVPANNRRGARPRLALPLPRLAVQGSTWLDEPRVQPAPYVELTFDRAVDPLTVSPSHVSVARDGVPVIEGISVQQVGSSKTKFRIMLPQQLQTPRSSWFATYSPSGQVLTDDIATRSFPLFSSFPAAEDSVYKTIYVAEDTGKRYSKSPAGYLELASGSPPLDENGIAYLPEPSWLACRAMWVMADSPAPELIDTNYLEFSVGAGVGLPPVYDVEMPELDPSPATVTLSGGCALTAAANPTEDAGLIRLSASYTANAAPEATFAQVPNGACEPANCCLRFTSVDPCPPRVFAQPVLLPGRYASAIRTSEDIGAISVSFFSEVFSGTPDIYGTDGYRLFPDNQAYTAQALQSANNLWLAEIPHAVDEGELVANRNLWVAARRSCREFGGLQTTTLGELCFDIFTTLVDGRIYAQQPQIFNWAFGYGWQGGFSGTVVLSAEQEAMFASGGAVTLQGPVYAMRLRSYLGLYRAWITLQRV